MMRFMYMSAGNLAAVTIFMILLTLIQAFYQPSVQASIRFWLPGAIDGG